MSEARYRVSCIAEKFLANADRGGDEATLGRDAIDLAFMLERWGDTPARQGAAIARLAYGEAIDRAAKSAVKKLLDNKPHFKRCVAALSVSDSKRLSAGLARLAQTDWAKPSSRKRGQPKG